MNLFRPTNGSSHNGIVADTRATTKDVVLPADYAVSKSQTIYNNLQILLATLEMRCQANGDRKTSKQSRSSSSFISAKKYLSLTLTLSSRVASVPHSFCLHRPQSLSHQGERIIPLVSRDNLKQKREYGFGTDLTVSSKSDKKRSRMLRHETQFDQFLN